MLLHLPCAADTFLKIEHFMVPMLGSEFVTICRQFHLFIRPSSDGTYYGMVMSVLPTGSPSVRPSDSPSVRVSVRPFSTLFSYMLWHIQPKFAHGFLLLYYRSSSSVVTLRQFLKSYASLWTQNIGNVQFSALFSYMLWHIELKFSIWLCFNVLQIKFKCRHSASVWVSVRPSIFCTCLLYALTIELKF